MTSSSRKITETSWELLALSNVNVGHTARELPEFMTANGAVMLSCDSKGVRHILVPINAKETVVSDTDSRGVQLIRVSFDDEGKRRDFLDIRCPEPRLHRVFNQIASAMLDEIAAEETQPVKACLRVLESWRALLQRAATPLGEAALRGIFGELWFLSELSRWDTSVGNKWRGPDGYPQDFVSIGGAFEIKTTTRHPPKRISITSIDQLNDEGHAFLTLVVVSLTRDPEGIGVGELIDTCVGQGLDRELLLDQLAKLGFHEQDLLDTLGEKYRVVSSSAYRVDDDFPRLTMSSLARPLPAGIVALGYDLDLHGLSAHLISPTEFRDQQKKFAGKG